MQNSVLMRSINTLYLRQNNSLILKLTSGQRKNSLTIHPPFGTESEIFLIATYNKFFSNYFSHTKRYHFFELIYF
jgi:hypothetical protein